MYDFSRYDNLFPPSAWLFLLGICALAVCQFMMLHFEQEIRAALARARKRTRHADPNYIAHPERRSWLQWRHGRSASYAVTALGGVGWAISL